MMNARIGSVFAILGLTATIAVGAGGTTLSALPFLDQAYPGSSIKAMSANGEYITTTMKDAANVTQVVVYQRGVGNTVLPNPSAPTVPSLAGGIDLRANGDLVVSANVGGAMRDWHSSTNSWVVRYKTDGTTLIGNAGSQNSVTVGTDGMTYYATVTQAATTVKQAYGLTLSGPQGQTQSYITTVADSRNSMNGVSATGRVAGWGRVLGSSNERAYWSDTGGTANAGVNLIPGFDDDPLVGTHKAQGYGISRDGDTVVGMAHDPTFAAPRVNGWTPFVYKISTNTLIKSPLLPDTTSTSTFYAVSGDGKIAVGNNYGTIDGVNRDRGVFYDMRDANPANWQLYDVKAYFAGLGVDMSHWVSVGRVYSVSADGLDMAGEGLWDADGNPDTTTDRVTRGFIATIPEPATMMLLALGGLALIRRR